MARPAQLLLQYQRLVDRERGLRDSIERLESLLQANPEVVRLEEKVEAARVAQEAAAGKLHESDRAREGHRPQRRSRERELVSGRPPHPAQPGQRSGEGPALQGR